MSSSEKGTNILLPGPSKTCPPDLSKILPRPRLQKIFEKNSDKRLILVIGQAAQGKTTAAAGWHFQRNDRSSIWINLDQGDSDPVNLFYLLVQALHQERKDRSIKVLSALPSHTFGPREGLYRYREWASAIYETFNEPAQVFLDGLDRLAPESESFLFIQVLIEKMPPTFQYILTSRAYPPLSLEFQNLKMGRQALLLKNEDLAFTTEEIKRYARECQGLTLDWEQVNHVHKVTEGWIGGILMLVDSLSAQSFQSALPNFVWELPERFQREAFQYFNQEAFKSLPPLQRDFLLRSSILKRLEPDIIREILPGEDGESILKELTRKNQFIQAFPAPDKGVVFRYHQLFKDFLNTLVRSKVSETEWCRWHLLAGACYQKKGGLEEAIDHFLEARAFQEASSLIKEIGLALIKKGRLTDLEHWLRKLPKPLIQTDPWLLLFGTINNQFITLEENIRILKTAIELFKHQRDRSGLLLGMAFLIEAEFTWGTYHLELIGEAENLLTFSDDPSHVYERALLWSQIGLTQALHGNPRKGYWACQTAYLLANQLADNLLQTRAMAHAIISLSILGEFRQAERLLTELNSVSWGIPNAEIRFISTLSRAIYLIFKGEVQAALGLCNTLEEEVEKHDLAYLYPLALFHKQVALVYAREHQQAGQIGNQLMNLALATDNGFLKGIIYFFKGISAYWSDRRSEARSLIDQSLKLIESGVSCSDLLRIGTRLARGLLNNRPQTRASAIKETRELLSYLESIQSNLIGTECHLTLGLLYHDQGQKEKARQHLQAGFKQAQQRNYNHFMIISPQDMVRVCLLAQECFKAGNDTADFAAALVIQKFGHSAREELEKLSQHPNSPIGRNALDIRRSIHRNQTPLLRIETFGGLNLYFDNQLMPEKAWDRIKPRQLLIAILSEKNEKVQKEVLIEALWPEEQPEVGEKNFKTTLQRLRNSLEPEISPVFGSSYLHLHHNLVFLDEGMCRIDVRKFCALSKEGEEKEKRGDIKGALTCFIRAVELYQGDFIPEERYAPWAECRRMELKQMYIELLTRSARYHEQSGAFKKAVGCLKQALETDPLLEEAYRSLMTLYAGKNLYNEALRVFEACRKALKDELDTKPDPATIALYQGIRERAQKS